MRALASGISKTEQSTKSFKESFKVCAFITCRSTRTNRIIMAYTSTEYSSRPPPYNQQIGETGVFVVNQQPQPRRQFQFPISFPPGPVLAVSIVKCIVGSLYFIFGIVNIFAIPYFTSFVAFPIWCGLLVSCWTSYSSQSSRLG